MLWTEKVQEYLAIHTVSTTQIILAAKIKTHKATMSTRALQQKRLNPAQHLPKNHPKRPKKPLNRRKLKVQKPSRHLSQALQNLHAHHQTTHMKNSAKLLYLQSMIKSMPLETLHSNSHLLTHHAAKIWLIDSLRKIVPWSLWAPWRLSIKRMVCFRSISKTMPKTCPESMSWQFMAKIAQWKSRLSLDWSLWASNAQNPMTWA